MIYENALVRVVFDEPEVFVRLGFTRNEILKELRNAFYRALGEDSTKAGEKTYIDIDLFEVIPSKKIYGKSFDFITEFTNIFGEPLTGEEIFSCDDPNTVLWDKSGAALAVKYVLTTLKFPIREK